MKFAFRNVQTGKYVSSWDYPHTLIANRDAIGPGETFELIDLDPPAPPPAAWPPAPGTHPPKPPNIVTTDVEACRERVRWGLWNWNSNDDESYWMNAIVLNPEPGHQPGWTEDDYWYNKIAVGDGVGKGYVWPAQ